MKADDPRMPAAIERLAISRERLRQTLHEASEPAGGHGGKPSALWAAVLALPGAKILSDAVHNWWQQHPMHLAGVVASNAARSVVRPMARRSPYTLVLAAMAVGGLLFWLKPWRGILKPALLAGLLPQIVSRAVAHVPIESWLSALLSMVMPRGSGGSHDDPAVHDGQARPQHPPAHGDTKAGPRPPSSTLH